MEEARTKNLAKQASPMRSLPTGHEEHCFVVMPFGRGPAEQEWFKGWYEAVIRPAVLETGYTPILLSSEKQPRTVDDKIRTHLALDPMVVVDLGGAEPEDDPNANVMYELGMRHALGFPLVIMAWKGQRLPFDVDSQRVITDDRKLIDHDFSKQKLISFIRAAQEGEFYRPMDAVSGVATIQATSQAWQQGLPKGAVAVNGRVWLQDLYGLRAVFVDKHPFYRFAVMNNSFINRSLLF